NIASEIALAVEVACISASVADASEHTKIGSCAVQAVPTTAVDADAVNRIVSTEHAETACVRRDALDADAGTGVAGAARTNQRVRPGDADDAGAIRAVSHSPDAICLACAAGLDELQDLGVTCRGILSIQERLGTAASLQRYLCSAVVGGAVGQRQ